MEGWSGSTLSSSQFTISLRQACWDKYSNLQEGTFIAIDGNAILTYYIPRWKSGKHRVFNYSSCSKLKAVRRGHCEATRKLRRQETRDTRLEQRQCKALSQQEACYVRFASFSLYGAVLASAFSQIPPFTPSSRSSVSLFRSPFPPRVLLSMKLNSGATGRFDSRLAFTPRLPLPLTVSQHYFPRAPNFSITFIRMQLRELTWLRTFSGIVCDATRCYSCWSSFSFILLNSIKLQSNIIYSNRFPRNLLEIQTLFFLFSNSSGVLYSS